MNYHCRICGLDFTEIPQTWTRIANVGRRGAWQTWTDSNGVTHDVRKIRDLRSLHEQWHKTRLKDGCEFCFPIATPAEPEPLPTRVEIPLELLTGEQQPELPQEEPQQEVITVVELQPGETAMSFAFRNRRTA